MALFRLNRRALTKVFTKTEQVYSKKTDLEALKESIDDLVAEAVEKYLTEHPATDTPIDDTLSKSGQAADAAAVGKALEELKELIGSISNIPLYAGETTVTPKADSETVLETADTRLDSDVTVTAIPYSDVTNDAGGKTIKIA